MAKPHAMLASMFLVTCPCALALNPELDVSQYAHTAWKIRDGFTKGPISSITQTPDGYLWLGTEFGLLRFDGVRNVPWQPPPDQRLPSNNLWSLLTARDGTLWIGTLKGLASWKDGKLTQYAEFAGQLVNTLLEDREGSVWVGNLAVATGKLCAIRRGSVQCYGGDGSFGHGPFRLYADSKNNVWAAVMDGLWRWKPDPAKFYPMPGEQDSIRGFSEGEDGALLFGTGGGIRRLVEGKSEAYPLPGSSVKFKVQRLLRDRDGGLWIGTSNQGLVHVHHRRTDVFAQFDGLSGDYVQTLFEDREGDIWAATLDGLDRFRNFGVATFSVNQGLSSARVGSVLAARDGSVWLGTYDGLNRWNEGQVTIYRKRSDPSLARRVQRLRVREIHDDGLPDNRITSLFQDERGRIWVATPRGIAHFEDDRFVPTSSVPSRIVHSIVEEGAGNLWINDQEQGLLRFFDGRMAEQVSWARLGIKDLPFPVVPDRVQGGLWLGFFQGGLKHFKDGQIRASYAAASGLGEGRVHDLRIDRDGTLWAATEGGLSRLKNGRIATLTKANGLPCDGVNWSIEDDDRSLWLFMPCGMVRIARSELEGWAGAIDIDNDSKRSIQATVFDSSDGVRARVDAGGYTPYVAKTRDGKLWFTSREGVSVIDPRRLPINKLPPPVHIEQITADRKPHDANGGLHLPPRVRDLQIDYTALSLVAPEKVRFRYKLEGRDHDWQDAGNRRQAFYSDLPPRDYRFRVIASNNSDVWNEAGAFLDFTIDPEYYQTTWFRLSCVAAILALLGALYQLRLRQMARQFNARMEERINERTRIARDFHDTLLQSFQGVLLKLHAVTFLLSNHPEARKTLENVIEQAREALTEGRNAVQGLRSSTIITNDLAQAIGTIGEEISAEVAAHHSGQSCPEFRVQVEGTSRDLAPLVRDEVYRIAGEALRNAFKHAYAKRIEVEIYYDRRQLRVRVRDDGKGIDSEILEGGRRSGHHGLPGMQERAKLVGGKLAVFSKPESGTEVELTIPGSVAYAKSGDASRSMSSGKGT